MPEILRENGEQPQDELIAAAMQEWLAEEIDSSGIGRNAVLDNFFISRKSFMLRADHPKNRNIAKNSGHYDRLKLWTSQFTEDPTNDYTTARQLFCAQMYLSGMYRMECFVVANDEAEYRFRRFGGQALGIGMDRPIQARVAQYDSVLTEDLAAQTCQANEKTNRTLRALHDRNGKENTIFNYVRFLNSRDQWLQSLTELQHDWLDLSTDYILHAAETRGNDLARVPFLEPKSISDDPQIYYPFSS